MAANPPDGAILDYALPPAVKGPVTLTVLDAQGRTVRHYTSATPVKSLDPSKLAYAPAWVPLPPRLVTAAGMHRFVWDLHYAPQGKGEKGVWAPPGKYTVQLQADGQTVRQPLTVQPDPRVQVSVAAMQRQFELARQVQAAQARADAASAQAQTLLKALDAAQSGGSSGQAPMQALIARTVDLSGVQLHPDPRNSIPQAPANTASLRALSIDLAKLELAVDGADADPSQDVQAAYTTLSTTLDTTLGQWQHLKQDDLTRVNATRKAAGKPAIEL
jgi:hypothetical protein